MFVPLDGTNPVKTDALQVSEGLHLVKTNVLEVSECYNLVKIVVSEVSEFQHLVKIDDFFFKSKFWCGKPWGTQGYPKVNRRFTVG